MHFFGKMTFEISYKLHNPGRYWVTELNVTQKWIEWAGRLAFGCTAEYSLSGLHFMPSPGTCKPCGPPLCLIIVNVIKISPSLLLQSVVHPSMPFYILSAISLLASVSVIFLPETGGEDLANTIEEGEVFGNGQPFFHLLFMERRRKHLAKINELNLNQPHQESRL